MVNFLIHRPIAVSMTFFALLLLGLVSYKKLPVSLLPDINIPEITVKASYPGFTSREMENNVTSSLRRVLLQCTGLDNLESQTTDGQATIRMRFDYGINIDFASIEVNEKIDMALNSLPADISRPSVVKASASDIPVFYVDISVKDEKEKKDFIELSQFVQNVIRKRLEQQPEVGIVDISGDDKPQILIVPDESKTNTLGITPQMIENTFSSNNISIGNIMVNDGHYRYNIRFSSRLYSIKEISNLYISGGNRVVHLKDIANISVVPQKKDGAYYTNGKKGISLAIIKQADAKMQDLKTNLKREIYRFERDYPGINFSISQDQTALLDYAIQNLKLTLLVGAVLAFLIVFLFLSNIRLPILMGIVIPVSVISSILFFMLFKISINIISLSGLILGIGMMIDNSIIVIDNISQFRERNYSLEDACIKGTNDVIRPLLSSALTTTAVFIPLVFISGIAGALFLDQAVTVAIGLFVSFLVSITLLPMIYYIMHKKQGIKPGKKSFQFKTILPLTNFYSKGFNFIFKYRKTTIMVFLCCILFMLILFKLIKKQSFPDLPQKDLILDVDWNENLNIDSALKNVNLILDKIRNIETKNVWIGPQDYVLNDDYFLSASKTRIYIVVKKPQLLYNTKSQLDSTLKAVFKKVKYSFKVPENIFEKTFIDREKPFVIRLQPEDYKTEYQDVRQIIYNLSEQLNIPIENNILFQEFIVIKFDQEKLLMYNVSLNNLYNTIKTQFNENNIGTLKSFNSVIPVIIGANKTDIEDVIKYSMVKDYENNDIPVSQFVSLETKKDLKTIYAGSEGEYIPLGIEITVNQRKSYESKVNHFFRTRNIPFKYSFSGSVYTYYKNFRQLIYILLISLGLLYFILAAQFESLIQPLIIIIEIPIDIFGVLLLLWLTGGSLNIMAILGIIVMSGIVINDSILKIDTINRLIRYEGYNIFDAIHEGGKRRLRPIIMTSLTTIFALIPFLFGKGLGSVLQRPLALCIIGGLILGTLVSLFFVPLTYWFIYRNKSSI